MMLRLLLMCALLALLPACSHAAYLYSGWTSGDDVIRFSDPAGDGSPSANDILYMWWARDASGVYLRLDLAGPLASDPYTRYAIYADTEAGGSTPGFAEVPTGLSGIDNYISIRYDGGYPNGIDARVHYWFGGFFASAQLNPAWVQTTENGNTTLEWSLPLSYPGGEYEFWGAVMDAGSPFTNYDVTAAAHTPEPCTVALLGLGLAGLYARRRRRG